MEHWREKGRLRETDEGMAGAMGAWLLNSGGTPEIRAEVARRFPHLRVDWDAIDRARAVAPPREQAATAAGVPNDRLEWLELERRLRYRAALAVPCGAPRRRIGSRRPTTCWPTGGPPALLPHG